MHPHPKAAEGEAAFHQAAASARHWKQLAAQGTIWGDQLKRMQADVGRTAEMLGAIAGGDPCSQARESRTPTPNP